MDPLFSQSALKGNAILYPLTMRIKKTSLKIYDMISNWLSCFYFVSKDSPSRLSALLLDRCLYLVSLLESVLLFIL